MNPKVRQRFFYMALGVFLWEVVVRALNLLVPVFIPLMELIPGGAVTQVAAFVSLAGVFGYLLYRARAWVASGLWIDRVLSFTSSGWRLAVVATIVWILGNFVTSLFGNYLLRAVDPDSVRRVWIVYLFTQTAFNVALFVLPVIAVYRLNPKRAAAPPFQESEHGS